MKCQRSRAALALFVALLWLGAPAALRAQVLQQVPSDAPVVIKITNLKAVSDKVAKFATALGLAEMSPQLADPLGSMQEEMKIKEGLDTAGELALVFTKDLLEASSPEEVVMVLLPVTDYKAFLSNLEGAKTDGPVTTFHPGGGDKELHAANWGKYAVVAQNKALLAQRPTGLKLSPLAAREAKEKDAFLFLNIPTLAPKALEQIEQARAEAMGMLENELGNEGELKEFAPVAKAAFGQVLKISEGFLRNSTSVSMGLHLSDEGLTGSAITEFKPESYAGKMTSLLKNAKQPLLIGLPARKYLAAGGMVVEPKITSQLIGDALDPISKELAATKSGKGLSSVIEAVKRFVGAAKSVTFGAPMPTAPIGAESVMQNVFVVKGDAKALADAQKQVMEGLGEMTKTLPKDSGVALNVEITPGAKSVGDVKLDTAVANLVTGENDPNGAQIQQVAALVFGPAGIGGTYGPVNKDTFVMVQGGTDKLLGDVVKSAQTPQDPIGTDAKVKMVSGHLPAQQVAVEYIFVDNIIASVVRYSEGMGFPIKLKLPPNQAPIGISAATEGSALRFDGFIATELIQNVVAGGMQMKMEMEGEGGGGGGNKEGL
jgi:hypothetical protein